MITWNIGKMIRHIIGDCLDEIPKLKNKSVQLVVTSPPYFNSENKRFKRSYTVPVGEPLFDILEVMEVLKPKMKPEGFICLNLGFSYSEGKVNRVGELVRQIERRTHWYNVDRIFWHKKNPIPIANRLSNSVETIEVFAEQPPTKYPKKIKYEHNFIESAVGVSKNTESTKPFPTDIPRKCIDVFSKKGDLVVDCFEGKGTTGYVCKTMERNYIGMEISSRP